MAVKGWAVGLPAAALVGTNKLPWEALGNVRELYLCAWTWTYRGGPEGGP